LLENEKDSSDWVSQNSKVWLIAREAWEKAVSVNEDLSSACRRASWRAQAGVVEV